MIDNPESRDGAEPRIGYGRPPKHTQFQNGNRANPYGRGAAKRSDFAETMRETLAAKVEINQGRRKRKVSRREAIVLSLFDKAKRGDLNAANRLLDLHGGSAKAGDGGPMVIDVFNLPPDEDDEGYPVPGREGGDKPQEGSRDGPFAEHDR
jgi:hypothetical protein